MILQFKTYVPNKHIKIVNSDKSVTSQGIYSKEKKIGQDIPANVVSTEPSWSYNTDTWRHANTKITASEFFNKIYRLKFIYSYLHNLTTEEIKELWQYPEQYYVTLSRILDKISTAQQEYLKETTNETDRV